MTVESIKGAVQSAIQRAAKATGVDFSFLMRTAKRESGYNPSAKATTSSAGGLFQFVDQTWLSVLKKHGSKYGYARYADLISKGSDGRYYVQGADARKAVMGLKLDPHASSLMAGEMASDHTSYLRDRVGRAPTSGELYAAHFLGPKGSARLIEAAQTNPAGSAAALFPDAARANPTIFYRQGRAATVGEVYANLSRTGGSGPVQVKAPDENEGGFVQYASARTLDHIQQQKMLIDLILRQPGDSGLGAFGGSDSEGGMARVGGSLFSTEMLRVLSEANDKTKR